MHQIRRNIGWGLPSPREERTCVCAFTELSSGPVSELHIFRRTAQGGCMRTLCLRTQGQFPDNDNDTEPEGSNLSVSTPSTRVWSLNQAHKHLASPCGLNKVSSWNPPTQEDKTGWAVSRSRGRLCRPDAPPRQLDHARQVSSERQCFQPVPFIYQLTSLVAPATSAASLVPAAAAAATAALVAPAASLIPTVVIRLVAALRAPPATALVSAVSALTSTAAAASSATVFAEKISRKIFNSTLSTH